MKTILRVKNFGPITDAELDLRNVNVLIGPQASGKSTLAKLYTICKSPVMYHEIAQKSRFSKSNDLLDVSDSAKLSIEKLKESFDFYSIGRFFTEDSVIEFESPTHSLSVNKNQINFQDDLKLDNVIKFFSENKWTELNDELQKLRQVSIYYNFEYVWLLYKKRNGIYEKTTFSDFYDEIDESDTTIDALEAEILVNAAIEFKHQFFQNKAIYIPAERTIVTLLKQASLNLRVANIPIPEHLLDYAAQYESATFKLESFDLSFLSKKTQYKNIDGKDLIFFGKGRSIPLAESASGLQSVVPMLLPIQFLRSYDDFEFDTHYSFVIEEPETNLFPRAQYDVLKFLEKGRIDDHNKLDFGSTHTYTTHSPYILSALNNMLYAFKQGNNVDIGIRKKIESILGSEHWINPNVFSAYEIKNGKAKSIFNRKTGLIKENVVDAVSEDILDDFRKIALASMPD